MNLHKGVLGVANHIRLAHKDCRETKNKRTKGNKQMINTFMLVMSIITSNGQQQDIALAFNLSFHDCNEIAFYVSQSLASNAELFCELEGVAQ